MGARTLWDAAYPCLSGRGVCLPVKHFWFSERRFRPTERQSSVVASHICIRQAGKSRLFHGAQPRWGPKFERRLTYAEMAMGVPTIVRTSARCWRRLYAQDIAGRGDARWMHQLFERSLEAV